MTKRIFRILSAALLASALLACGQKGPLYLPPEPETTEVPEETPETPQESASNSERL